MSQNHSLFPVQMTAHWQQPEQLSVNSALADWLLNPESLTARLQSLCHNFRVEVLGQQVQTCSAQEANEDVLAGEEVLVREVVLWCDDSPQVYARSLLPLASLTGEQQKLAHLGDQPLGQVLFNQSTMQRKVFQIAKLEHTPALSSLLNELGLQADNETTSPIFARRSVFVIEDKPFMVAEAFLPNSFAYQPSKVEDKA